MTDLTTGWHPELTNEEHHKLGAISSSGLKLFAQSPRKYFHRYVARDWTSEPYSSAFLLGTCVHMWLLEPELAQKKIAACSEKSTTKAYKVAVLAQWPEIDWDHADNGGGRFYTSDGDTRYVLSEEDHKKVSAMVNSAQRHEMYKKLRALSTPEVTGIAQVGQHRLSCRGDLRGKLPNGHGFFIDIKTCESISEYMLQNTIFSLGYHLQQIHYLHVANLIEPGTYKYFYFLFVEKKFPHECGLVSLEISPDENYTLQNHYLKLLTDLLQCHETNTWPSFDKSKVASVKIPYWVLNRLI